MSEETFPRRLSAILSADVAGYSRLMRDDEDTTVRTITTYRNAMTHMIQQYRGRVVDSPGDNILAEFTSVVDAVNCAVEMQRELAERNAELPEERKMRFRIGINLGDVIEDGQRIYGDGVNVAARMEALAEAGGICISGMVHGAVESKIGLKYEFIGEHEVKNIDKPIRAFRVLTHPGDAAHRVVKAKRAVGRACRKGFWGLLIVILAGAGFATWQFYFQSPPIEPASVKKMAYPLPDKPSIAVLPFVNMSDDPKQEYFSDGITEEIITTLSKSPKLFVIARNSTFSYKGKSVKVNKIAEELGVQYVLEGSVRKSGDKVRITAQLIDALSGNHLWAERYDGNLRDIFALQDEITIKVVGALRLKLTDGELANIATKGTKNLNAYLILLKAQESIYKFTKEDNAQARRLCKEAIALDPNYAAAYIYLGVTHYLAIDLGSSRSPQKSLEQAFKYLKKAQTLDNSIPAAHTQLGWLYVMTRQYDKGVAECERAIELNPNSAKAHIWMGLVLNYIGRHQEAVRYSELALRLDPLPPAYYLRFLGWAYAFVGRYDEAIEFQKKALQHSPKDLLAYEGLTVTYALANRLDEARSWASKILVIDPKYSIDQSNKSLMLFKHKADIELVLNALRKAGIPEHPPLALPDEPSIAVLPFVNMSGEPKQDFLADGLSEQIIASISKLPSLFVISRTSSFKFKGKAVDVRQVGRELGVKYVLEGSFQRSGDKLRITAQLIEAATGRHLWAERYQRPDKDFFAIQDEITLKIIRALSLKLTRGEQVRLHKQTTTNLKAVEKVLEGIGYLYEWNLESNNTAKKLFSEAIALDPNYAMAYGLEAMACVMEIWLGGSRSPKESIAQAVKLLKKSISLDPTHEFPHSLLGHIFAITRHYDRALAECKLAVSLNPNSADALVWLAMTLSYVGKPQEAIPLYKKAMRLSPFPPSWYYNNLGSAYAQMGLYNKAIEEFNKSLSLRPRNLPVLIGITACYSMLGRQEQAEKNAAMVLSINPNLSAKTYIMRRPFKDEAFKKRLYEALLKAGLK